MSTPSYSFCAVRMVRVAPKPSLREASCWRVEVVKGGEGLRRLCLRSTDDTAKLCGRMRATAASAASALGRPNLSSFLPSNWVRVAVKGTPPGVVNPTPIDQYSWGLKISISDSRSQTSRRATDCTRLADFDPGSLRHSTGDRVKPTR